MKVIMATPTLRTALFSSGLIHLCLAVILIFATNTFKQHPHSLIEVSLRPASTTTRVATTPAFIPRQTSAKVEVKPKPSPSLTPKLEVALPQAETHASKTSNVVTEASAAQEAGNTLADARERYIAEITTALNTNKRYPSMARRLGQQGRVLLQFRLDRSGNVLAAEVLEKSPYESINRAARSLIDEINGLKPFPAEVQETSWLFTVPIEYKM